MSNTGENKHVDIDTGLTKREELESLIGNAAVSGADAASQEKLNLRNRIIDPTLLPQVKRDESTVLTYATIEADDTLCIGESVVRLNGDQCYAFNALLIHQGVPRSLGALRSMGFGEPGRHNSIAAEQDAFSSAVIAVDRKLAQAAGQPLVMQTGPTRYKRVSLHNGLILVDVRPIEPTTQNADLNHTVQPFAENGAATGLIDGRLATVSEDEYKQVDTTILSVVKAFAAHPQTWRTVQQFKSPKKSAPGTGNESDLYRLEAQQYRLLSMEEMIEQFIHIEHGVSVWKTLENPDSASAEQTQALVAAAAAYQILYNCNQRLVMKLVASFRPQNSLEQADLIGEGNIGLSNAILHFDRHKGYTFATLAFPCIKHRLVDAMKRSALSMKYPVELPNDEAQVEQIEDELGSSSYDVSDKHTTEDESVHAGRDVKRKKIGLMAVGSLNIQIAVNDETFELGNTIADPKNELEERFSHLSASDEVQSLITDAGLSKIERAILSWRFGFVLWEDRDMVVSNHKQNNTSVRYGDVLQLVPSGGGLTHQQIADQLGITGERVRQIEQRAILNMRKTQQ